MSIVNKKLIGVYPSDLDDSFLAFAPEYLCRIRNIGEFDWFVDGIKVPDKVNDNFISKYDFIIQEINQIMPIFCRHYDDLPNLELHKRKILFTILNLADSLSKLNLSFVIFKTNSSHHIDSFICEMACRILSINQIFLYLTLFQKDRLLPMIQKDGIGTRKPLLLNISNFSFQNEINNIHSEYKASNLFLSRDKSLIFLVWKRIKADTLKNLVRFKNLIFSKKIIDSYTIRGWAFFTFINSVVSYKKAQIFLQESINVQKCSNFALINKKAFVLYLHFEPEATSFPEGGPLYNVLDLVATIRNYKFDAEIIIREHPVMGFLGENGHFARSSIARSVDLYRQLINMGCHFVDSEFVIGKFHIPVTLTGSIALERSLKGEKTIVLGYPWFRGVPGTYTLAEFISQNSFDNTNDEKVAQSAYIFVSNILNFNTLFNYDVINFYSIRNKTDSEKMEFWSEQKIMLTKLLDLKTKN